MKPNRKIFSWHHWCGLVVGIFLLLMSISGSILVFADDYESASDKLWSKVHNPSGQFFYDASLPAVLSKFPEWEVRSYNEPAVNETIIYELRKKEKRIRVYAHPINGQLLHITDNAEKKWFKQLLLFHYTWFAGTPGKIMICIIGLLFLVTLLTGFYVYRKSFIKVFSFRVRVNKKTTRSFHSSLHRIVGVWSMVFNLLIVATGLSMAYQVTAAALKSAGSTQPSAQAVINSVDAARATVLNQHSDFEIHLLRVRPNSNSIQFSGRYQDDPSYYGKFYSGFTVNGTTREVENNLVLRKQPLSKRVQSISGPLHFGNWGGLFIKILYCLFGFMPALLSITGFVIWWKKRKRKMVVKEKKTLVAA